MECTRFEQQGRTAEDFILKKQRIDFAAICETKKKGQGTDVTEDFIPIRTGIKEEKHAVDKVTLYIHKKYEEGIEH